MGSNKIYNELYSDLMLLVCLSNHSMLLRNASAGEKHTYNDRLIQSER